MRDTILFTSGIIPTALAALKRNWHVLDIASHDEALAYLQQCDTLPLAVAVGYATSQAAGSQLTAQEMLKEIHKLDANLPVIISTNTHDVPTIVELIKRGAFDYVLEAGLHRSDVSPIAAKLHDAQVQYAQQLVLAFTRATRYRLLQLENAQLRASHHDSDHSPEIQARSPQMRQVLELTRKVAPTPATVLITGESGTGKELIARAIHQRSGRETQPFVAVNCGALNEQLLTSELFGHVKGAFTGADTSRQGLIQQAGQGTLFLDEIATVPLSFQVMLLRVLEEGTARPVGSTETYPVKCRFIAASNRDLETLIHQGSFREDLWYRLNIFNIQLPALRQRTGDIAVLAHHFLRELATRYHKKIDTIAPAAMAMLEEYDWPGNVRQMRNVIERALIVAESDSLQLADFENTLRNPSHHAHSSMARPGHSASLLDSKTASYAKAMERFEYQLLQSALAQSQNNLSQAARRLKINRTTMIYRLKKLGIETGK